MLALLVGPPPDADHPAPRDDEAELACGFVPPELIALLWHTMRSHARRAGVQAVCCEMLSLLLAEDARRAALHRADVRVLIDTRATRHALQELCAALAMHWHDPAVVMPSLAALEDLIATVAARPGLLVPADVRELQALLHQISAAGDPADLLLSKRIGRIFHRMQSAALLDSAPRPKKR